MFKVIKTRIGTIQTSRREIMQLREDLKQNSVAIVIQQDLISQIEEENPESSSPAEILNRANHKVRLAVSKTLKISDTSPSILMDTFSNISKKIRWKVLSPVWKHTPPYDEILQNICLKFKIKEHQNLTTEQTIALHFFNETWQKVDSEKRTLFIEKLTQDQEENPIFTVNSSNVKSYLPELLGVGGIIAAQASQFGIYLAASTMVGAVSSAVSVTLPFAFYTTMSTSIAYLIGPVGWLIIALSLMPKFFGPNYKKIVHVVLIIAGTRANASLEYDEELRKERDIFLKMKEETQTIKNRLESSAEEYRKQKIILSSIAIIIVIVIALIT